MAKKLYIFFFLLPLLLSGQKLRASGSLLEGKEQDSITAKQDATPQNDAFYASNAVLYISSKSAIMLPGNLILHNSMMTGHGKVIMKSSKKQLLQSTHSTISNLEIDNPVAVLLSGELAVTEQLTLKKGVFDISKGLLVINPQNILLLDGGTIFKGNDEQLVASNPISSVLPPAMAVPAVIESGLLLVEPFMFSYKLPPFSFQETLADRGSFKKSFQPPKAV